MMSALSAIEMALWDIKGKALGVPVYELFGGKVRDSIPCYANAWFANARTPDDFATAAAQAIQLGYQALKWDPFGSSFRSLSSAELQQALSVIEAVKASVGNKAELLIEGHGRFELPTARRIARALEDYDVLWFEEPLIPGNLYHQIGSPRWPVCFSQEHKHTKPAEATGAGVIANPKRIREAMASIDPEFMILTEHVCDCINAHVHWTHGSGAGFSPAKQAFPALFRYTFPEYILNSATKPRYSTPIAPASTSIGEILSEKGTSINLP